jgi:hypothetical protein
VNDAVNDAVNRGGQRGSGGAGDVRLCKAIILIKFSCYSHAVLMICHSWYGILVLMSDNSKLTEVKMRYYAIQKVYDLMSEVVAEDVEDWDSGELIAKAGDSLNYEQAHRIVFSGMLEDVKDILVYPGDESWYVGLTRAEIEQELDREYADYIHDSEVF